MRGESIAAFASAVAATASACAAIYTLVFLSHQEAIAKSQLEATYQANLYSKQVDAISAYLATAGELSALMIRDGTYNITAGHFPSDAVSYQNALRLSASDYMRLTSDLSARMIALRLLVPAAYEKLVDQQTERITKLLVLITGFAYGPAPSKETALEYYKNIEQLEKSAEAIDRAFPNCVIYILKQGRPVTEQALNQCVSAPQYAVTP